MRMDYLVNYKKYLTYVTLMVLLFAIACGGGGEEPEMSSDTDTKTSTSTADKSAKPAAKPAASKKPGSKKAEYKAPAFETGSLNVTLEIISPPTAIDVLEGKAQFQTPGSDQWVDVIDAQPIEAGWSIRTLAVSRAILKFVDGSQLHIKPSSQVTIDKFDLVNGGPAQGGQRHARIGLDNGDVDFNVIKAESPPNTWVFLTADGAITIQGTEGSLGRRINVKQEELSTEEKAKLVINKKNAERKEKGLDELTDDQKKSIAIKVKDSEGEDLSEEEIDFREDQEQKEESDALEPEEKAAIAVAVENEKRTEDGLEELTEEEMDAIEAFVIEEEGGDLTADQEAALADNEDFLAVEFEIDDELLDEFASFENDTEIDDEELDFIDDLDSKLAIETDFKVELLEGTATMVKMGSEAPKEIEPTDADDITGGTGAAPGEEGGPPLGWTPEDGAFIAVGDNGDSSLDAAVVKPGVAYQKTEDRDVMPPQAPQADAKGAQAAIPDMDGDGIFGPSDLILIKDIAYIADLGVDVGDVVPDADALLQTAEDAGVADVNATVELAALAGPDAVDAIVEGGDIEAAVAVAEELFSDVAVVVNDAIAGNEDEGLKDLFLDFEPEIQTLTEDQADPEVLQALLASGEITLNVEPLVMAAGIDQLSGERLDLDALRELRQHEFEPPRSEPLFNEEGVQIGVKQPDQVVFDQTGNPIGKKPGDMVAVDESGAVDPEADVPDVFYMKDNGGEDKLHATTFFNAFLPKVPTSSEIGGVGEQALNMVTFDPDGNIVPTIIQYDPLGNPVGTLPYSDEFSDSSGAELTPPKLPIFEYGADGKVTTQVEMPMIVKDASGGIREFNVPPPIVFDENGDPLGMSEPPKLMMGDAGVSGFEAGRVLSKDFFSEQSAAIADSFAEMPLDGSPQGGMGIGGFGSPMGFIPSGAMDQINQYTSGPGAAANDPFGPQDPMAGMYDFDKYDLSAGGASFFDAGGTQKTGDEFRMQEIYRDTETGAVAGYQPITEVMCLTQDCFRDASQSDSVLAKIEEKVEVLSFDADGRAVIAEIGGQTLFTADGHLAGFIPPPIVMGGGGMYDPMAGPGGAGDALSFAQNDMMFFSAMDMAGPGMGGPGMGGPGMGGPGMGGPGMGEPGGFGLDFSQDMGEMTFMTRAAKNEEFGAAYNPNMGDAFEGPAGSFFDPFAAPAGGPGMGGPGAGPSMEFTLDLGTMFGPAMPPMPGDMPAGGASDFYDPAAGMTGFSIENDFAGMDDLFAIAGPEFGGYAPTTGGAMGAPMDMGPPPMDFFGPMMDYSFGSANDVYASELGAGDIGGAFFEDMNTFEDARAMNEATAFANKSFEVQGAYNEALGIERDIYIAPPMTMGGGMPGAMAGGPGMGAPGMPMTGPMTAPMEAPMAMDAFSFADPFADDPFADDPFGDPFAGDPFGDPFGGGGMFDNLIDAASTDISDRGMNFGPKNFEFDPDNAAAGMTMAPMPGAGAMPGTTGPMGAPGSAAAGAMPGTTGPDMAPMPGMGADGAAGAMPGMGAAGAMPGMGADGAAGAMPGMTGPDMAGPAPGEALYPGESPEAMAAREAAGAMGAGAAGAMPGMTGPDTMAGAPGSAAAGAAGDMGGGGAGDMGAGAAGDMGGSTPAPAPGPAPAPVDTPAPGPAPAPAPAPVYEAPAPAPVYEAPAPAPVYEAPPMAPVYP